MIERQGYSLVYLRSDEWKQIYCQPTRKFTSEVLLTFVDDDWEEYLEVVISGEELGRFGVVVNRMVDEGEVDIRVLNVQSGWVIERKVGMAIDEPF